MVLEADIIRIEKPADNIAILTFKPRPDEKNFSYKAGQYVEIGFGDYPLRSYSIASAPSNDGSFEVHIKDNERQGASSYAVRHAKSGETIKLGTVRGTAILTEGDENTPLLFLAGGMGIAPFKALIDDVLTRGHVAPVSLYWGARSREDLYLAPDFKRQAQETANFSFFPLIDEDVLAAAFKNEREWSNVLVFLSGPVAFIEHALLCLIAHGVRADQVRTDHTEILDRFVMQDNSLQGGQGA